MKANKILFATVLSLITFQAMSPSEILSSRAPASALVSEAASTSIEAILCKEKLKGEKLEAEIKKLLEGQQAVLKEVDRLKKENEDLKSKVAVASESVSSKKEENKKSDSSEMVGLMAQMTTMFTAQMQSQMQMQVQMMSMLSQIQNKFMPEISPYAFNPSEFSNIQSFGYPQAGHFGGFGNVGISAAATPWSDYQNPYSMMPSMNRQYLPQAIDFGFDFSQPMVVPQQQRLPAGQELQSPFRSQVIAV